MYNADIQSGRLDPKSIPVASAQFGLEPDDLAGLPNGFSTTGYICTRYLDNRLEHRLEGGPEVVVFSEEVRKDLRRLATHVDSRTAEGQEDEAPGLDDVIGGWQVGTTKIDRERGFELQSWLDSAIAFVDENDTTEDARHTRLLEYTRIPEQRAAVLEKLKSRLPVHSSTSNNYFRVRPNLHLRRLADRVEQDLARR